MRTLFIEEVERVAQRNKNQLAMLKQTSGEWQPMLWEEVWSIIEKTSFALLKSGCKKQQNVAIYSNNTPEWSITDISCQLINAVVVPIHVTENVSGIKYIIEHAEIETIFINGQEQFDRLLDIDLPTIKKIIVFKGDVNLKNDPRATYFYDFIKIEKNELLQSELDKRKKERDGDDLFTIVYTSGTTGLPKGVMLTHNNFAFQMESHYEPVAKQELKTGQCSLSFLPLSHIYERLWSSLVLFYGYANAYLENPSTIIDTVEKLKPNAMCSVPRIFEKIYAAIQQKISTASALKKWIFNWALPIGEKYHLTVKANLTVSPILKIKFLLADKLVLKTIRNIIGGNIKYAPSGGAPLAADLQKFFYSVGIIIRTGYGLSETCGSVSSQDPEDFVFGAAGKPMKGIKIRIGDQGEILLKGDNLMKGYYKNPEATREALNESGYLKTGDIGLFESNGEIRITDRLKDLMKTSGGKYIAPQMIEGLFTDVSYIEQLAIIADQKKFVSALVVPNFTSLKNYAKEINLTYNDNSDLISKPEIIAFYQNIIKQKTENLARFEKIQKFKLLSKPFTVEANEITASLKFKRRVIAENYKTLIDEMYTTSSELIN